MWLILDALPPGYATSPRAIDDCKKPRNLNGGIVSPLERGRARSKRAASAGVSRERIRSETRAHLPCRRPTYRARARAIWRGARLLRVCSFARSARVGAKRASVARIRSARGRHQWESNTSDFRCVESTGRSPPGGSGDALYIAVVISPRDDRDGRDDDGQARAPRVSREDGKAAGASAHAARMPGSHTPETRTSFAAVKRTRDADHHARSRLRATMSSSPDHAHSMSVRRGPASCGRRAHGHGGTTCRRECSRRVFCSRDQIFFLDVLFRVHESKKNKICIRYK